MKGRTHYRRESLKRLINRRWFSITLLGGIIAVILLGSLLMLKFEHNTNPEIQTYGDALWLSFVTMTTVGYGDKVPITPGGKATAITSMVLGIGLLTTFITARAAIKVDKAQRRAKGLDSQTSLTDHYVILGWNLRGQYLLERLSAAAKEDKVPVVLLAELERTPLAEDYVFFYHGNPTRDADQRRVNVGEARAVVLLADEQAGTSAADIDARTVLAALTAKAINQDVRMTAEVLEPENVQHLQRAGVEEVFDHNLVGGNLLAQSAMRHGVIDYVNALSMSDSRSRVYRLPVEPEFIGRSCLEVARELDQKEGYVVLGVVNEAGLQGCRDAGTFKDGDTLMVLSTKPPEGSA